MVILAPPRDGSEGSEFVRPLRSSFLGQLWTMIRRNLLLKSRSARMTIAEIFLPGVFLAVFVLFGLLMNRSDASYRVVPEVQEQPFIYRGSPGTGPGDFFPVGYAPENENTTEIMKQSVKYWNARNPLSTLIPMSFPSKADMEKFYLGIDDSNISSPRILAGIVFNDQAVTSLDYTLRFPYVQWPTSDKPYIRLNGDCHPYSPDDTTTLPQPGKCITNAYVYSGFTSLQNVLTAAYAKVRWNLTDGAMLLSTKMIPYTPVKAANVQGGVAAASMPASCLCNLISFYVVFLVIFVVTEKEKKHIASMQIMGLRPVVYWLSWIFLYLFTMLVVSVLALVFAKVFKIWPESSFVLLLIDCMLYGCSAIAMGFCVASLFHRPLIAGLTTFALMTAFGFLYLMENFVPDMPERARWVLAALSPTAFFMTMSRVSQAEADGWGIGFTNAMGDSTGFTFGHGLIMLSVDVLLYLLLAIYFDRVYPSDDSPRERPWFFLLPSYWFGPKKDPLSFVLDRRGTIFPSDDIEPVPDEMRSRVAISIHGLRKVFPTSKVPAVDGFTYEMYEDEILAILGHNGAGKTTLISMITGLLAPTSGRALVYGNDITVAEQLAVARTMIGICPQHDLLFDTVTVKEHIVFYARLKGFANDDVIIEYERIIDKIGLRTHADVHAEKLSGGQKRRLSIAIAVVGNPKILILDEPTSGVDPFSRRFLWDMIRNFRRGRCIIITTQSMQEADVFADRKLIISHGKLRCAGTSLFLKNRFGLGYHLTMSAERTFSEAEVEKFVTTRIAGAEKVRAHAGEISFVLPKAAVAAFPALFNDLDHNLAKLKIQTYGVSLTTMEEIFLKLADSYTGDANKPGMSLSGLPMLTKKKDYSLQAGTTFARPVKGAVSGGRKFLALAKIRFLLLFRSRLFLIFQILIPAVLLVMSGFLGTLFRDYMTRYTTPTELGIDELSTEFQATGAAFFFANKSGSDLTQLIDRMRNLGCEKLDCPNRLSFEPRDYNTLLDYPPHYAGYIFPNTTLGVNGSVNEAVISYNGSATHSIPFATNRLLNAVFALRTGSNEIFDMASHPFPSSNARFHAPVLNFAVLVGLAVVMIPGVFGIDVCRDRQLKIRSQIRMTGSSFWLYWGSSFVVHLSQFLSSFAMMLGILYAFKVNQITDAIEPVLVLFALHGAAMILFCYCASFFFTKSETASVGLPLPMAMISLVCYFVVALLYNVKKTTIALIAHKIFAFIFPFYGVFGGLFFVELLGTINIMKAKAGAATTSYFDWDSNILIVYVAHAVQIPIFTLLLVYLESRHFNQSFLQAFGCHADSCIPPAGPAYVDLESLAEEDDDVKRERNRVQEINIETDSTYAIVLRTLGKRFDIASPIKRFFSRKSLAVHVAREKIAVKNISMVFPKGEIFGLLGPNGAGKTTTLSMITGELTPTSGDIHVNGFNMYTQTLSALETMGSCPQTDTLWDDITMREHLELFAALNDLPASRRKDSIKTFSEGLCITEHLDKKSSFLSGGTKRKLTFVISMMGNPPLVLLDEPSTGMDPLSKRNLWDMIMQSFGGQRGAILTTHSMEEADALCDRIGIIVKGELQCIGSAQHLKDKFGSGYVLEIKLSASSGVNDAKGHAEVVSRLKSKITAIMPRAFCAEEFYNRFIFAVPKDQVTSLGLIFGELDKVKQSVGVEEYSFSQTTLEQVFLHFAKMQASEGVPGMARRTLA